MKALFKFLVLAVFAPLLVFGGATSSPPAWTYPGTVNITMPITVIFKNVTVLTTGVPADVGSFTVPAGYARYFVMFTTAGGSDSRIITEASSGSMTTAVWQLFDGPGGTGTEFAATATNSGPGGGTTGSQSSIVVGGTNPSTTQGWASGQTIYLRQTNVSANTGLISAYIVLHPMP